MPLQTAYRRANTRACKDLTAAVELPPRVGDAFDVRPVPRDADKREYITDGRVVCVRVAEPRDSVCQRMQKASDVAHVGGANGARVREVQQHPVHGDVLFRLRAALGHAARPVVARHAQTAAVQTQEVTHTCAATMQNTTFIPSLLPTRDGAKYMRSRHTARLDGGAKCGDFDDRDVVSTDETAQSTRVWHGSVVASWCLFRWQATVCESPFMSGNQTPGAVILSFTAYMKFLERNNDSEINRSGQLLSYKATHEHVSFTLVAWDHDEHDVVTAVVHNNMRANIVVPWTNEQPGVRKHTNVLKLAAYVEGGRCQVGTLFVTLQELRDLASKQGVLTIQHAFSPVCVIDLQIEEANIQALDAAIKESTMSRVCDITRLNAITDDICEHVLDSVQAFDRKLGGCFLPSFTGAKDFKNLKTLLPVYVNDKALEINMAHLQKTVSGRGKSVSLPMIMYLVHAACLCDGIASTADISTASWWTRFRLYTHTITLITADASYNEYIGDKAPIGVRPQCLASGERGVAYEFMESENIQVPFTQCNERGGDCEDWAMAILLVGEALRYHAQNTIPKLVDKKTGKINERAIMALELPISGFDLEKRVALLHKVMSLGSDPAMEVHLCTVTAVARSAQLNEGKAAKPCGHECCIAVYDDGTNKAAKVLEGTNWVDNTDEYTEEECKNVCGFVVERADELGADGVRVNMIQHVDGFYRCIFAVGEVSELICLKLYAACH